MSLQKLPKDLLIKIICNIEETTRKIVTEEKDKEYGKLIVDIGADKCGLCNRYYNLYQHCEICDEKYCDECVPNIATWNISGTYMCLKCAQIYCNNCANNFCSKDRRHPSWCDECNNKR